EAGRAEVRFDLGNVVIAEGNAVVESGRIVGEQVRDGRSGDLGRKVALYRVPDDQQIMSAGRENAAGRRIAANLVGEEHHPELTDDEIEALVGEGQIERVGGLEADASANALCRFLEH